MPLAASARPSTPLAVPCLLLALLACSSALACASPRPMARDGETDVERMRYETTTPDWAGQAASWDKLRRIETWLDGPGLRASDYWRIEAELERAEGRVVLAQREPTPAARLNERLGASRRAFEFVASHVGASTAQLARARAGLNRLRDVPAVSAPVEASSPGFIPSLVRRSQWGSRSPIPARMITANTPYYRITVHHSADFAATELDGTMQSSLEALRKIQRAHMDGANTGWGDIGYHFLIDPQGRVFEGRELTWQGAHAAGKANVGNVGVCMLGNFEERPPTPAALAALESLVSGLCERFDVKLAEIHGHNEFKSTDCPGRYLKSWVSAYRKGVTGPALAAAAR